MPGCGTNFPPSGSPGKSSIWFSEKCCHHALPLMRLLYLYPEEWTGRRAREEHTLSTCLALSQQGLDVTLATAGGLPRLPHEAAPGLRYVELSRTLGPIRSAAIFRRHFHQWLRTQPRFDLAYIIH